MRRSQSPSQDPQLQYSDFSDPPSPMKPAEEDMSPLPPLTRSSPHQQNITTSNSSRTTPVISGTPERFSRGKVIHEQHENDDESDKEIEVEDDEKDNNQDNEKKDGNTEIKQQQQQHHHQQHSNKIPMIDTNKEKPIYSLCASSKQGKKPLFPIKKGIYRLGK